MTTLATLADWPATAADATAERLIRYASVIGYFHHHRAQEDGLTRDEARLATAHAAHCHAVVTLLTRLKNTDQDAADDAARTLWADWNHQDVEGGALATANKTEQRRELAAIADYPTSSSDVTADRIIRAYAVNAHADMARMFTSDFATREFRDAAALALPRFGLVELLTFIRDEFGEEAVEAAAHRLWAIWDDGTVMDELSHERLAKFGIDPDRVTALATGK